MLVAAGVFPHPPVLVPQVAGGRSGDLDGLRATCADGVARLLESEPDVLVVVGGAEHTQSYPEPVAGSLVSYGVDLTIGRGPARLPLSLTVGRWLLDAQQSDAGAGDAVVAYESIAADTGTPQCLDLGRSLARRSLRVALMVMGDGSACRDEKAPGFHDPAALPYDDHIAAALDDGDRDALAAVDPEVSARLLASGRAAWQVLAGAVDAPPVEAGLLDYQAPYGVAYFVASWRFGAANPS